ncbi:MAG: nuclear transport factor 2 family protein [Myxococcota bacterium]
MSDELRDRLEIGEILARYASSLDERDWPRLATCFTPDAVGDYGMGDPLEGYAAIEALCRGTLEPLDASQHLVGSIEIDLDGDTATSRCALQAQHTRRGLPDGENYLIGGTYRDRWVRTDTGWRIAHRQLRMVWSEGNPAVVAR